MQLNFYAQTVLNKLILFYIHVRIIIINEAVFKMAGTLINLHNIHNLWSPQKCASVNAGLCVELRHLAIARAQTCIRDCNADVASCGERPKTTEIKVAVYPFL